MDEHPLVLAHGKDCNSRYIICHMVIPDGSNRFLAIFKRSEIP